MATLKFTQEEANDIIFNALCDGMAFIRGYDCFIHCDKFQYDVAREKFETPTIEDVYMEVLKSGNKLIWVDVESMEETKVDLLTMTERLNLVDFDVISNFISEQYDAEDADIVLQTIFLGEVRFA